VGDAGAPRVWGFSQRHGATEINEYEWVGQYGDVGNCGPLAPVPSCPSHGEEGDWWTVVSGLMADNWKQFGGGGLFFQPLGGGKAVGLARCRREFW